MPATKPRKDCTTIYHRKRHEEWLDRATPICADCLRPSHLLLYPQVRYPLLRCCGEKCECPCGHERELVAA